MSQVLILIFFSLKYVCIYILYIYIYESMTVPILLSGAMSVRGPEQCSSSLERRCLKRENQRCMNAMGELVWTFDHDLRACIHESRLQHPSKVS